MALLQVDCALSAAPDHIHLGPHFVVGPGPLVDYTVVGKSGGELETIERANWRGRHDEEIAGAVSHMSARSMFRQEFRSAIPQNDLV